ncbi:O-methyltransferase-domain-containing protein [Rhodocollybia butyracea]|uniref:O-methyltransferase-domain-containing protein n=1 Tax=Rhodocollybia butyracea TaxID=206335 RepID=A0A9P5U2D7_9AGAR|nr:O-methyltransferase-domain-containing protein [Rhodocollybia butyracea]
MSIDPRPQTDSQKQLVPTLKALLASIESSGSILLDALQNGSPQSDGELSIKTAADLDLPFHESAYVALHASQLRSSCERLAQLVTPPRHLILEAAGSLYITMAIDVVVKSDIATIIHKVSTDTGCNGVPVDILAEKSEMDSDLLGRLMRHLAVAGIFQETSLNVFKNTLPSLTLVNNPEFKTHLELITHEHAAAMPFFPELVSKRYSAPSASSPLYPVSAFSLYTGGQTWFEWLHSEANRSLNFNIAMRGMSQTEGLAFLPVDYPFHMLPAEKRIVDVGGGIGSLPTILLPSVPKLSFIVQDLAPAVSQATVNASPLMKQWIAEGKVQFCIQDCFSPQPSELDNSVFALKNIMHNYPDSEALKILVNLRKANPYKLLIIDRIVVPQLQEESKQYPKNMNTCLQASATMYDLTMALLVGGKNRTFEEWSHLLEQASFHLDNIFCLRASTGQAIIEATCK